MLKADLTVPLSYCRAYDSWKRGREEERPGKEKDERGKKGREERRGRDVLFCKNTSIG
jgi:hypothetical protein